MNHSRIIVLVIVFSLQGCLVGSTPDYDVLITHAELRERIASIGQGMSWRVDGGVIWDNETIAFRAKATSQLFASYVTPSINVALNKTEHCVHLVLSLLYGYPVHWQTVDRWGITKTCTNPCSHEARESCIKGFPPYSSSWFINTLANSYYYESEKKNLLVQESTRNMVKAALAVHDTSFFSTQIIQPCVVTKDSKHAQYCTLRTPRLFWFIQLLPEYVQAAAMRGVVEAVCETKESYDFFAPYLTQSLHVLSSTPRKVVASSSLLASTFLLYASKVIRAHERIPQGMCGEAHISQLTWFSEFIRGIHKRRARRPQLLLYLKQIYALLSGGYYDVAYEQRGTLYRPYMSRETLKAFRFMQHTAVDECALLPVLCTSRSRMKRVLFQYVYEDTFSDVTFIHRA